jgi:hypothetical protein
MTLTVLGDKYVGVKEQIIALSKYLIPKSHYYRDIRKKQ